MAQTVNFDRRVTRVTQSSLFPTSLSHARAMKSSWKLALVRHQRHPLHSTSNRLFSESMAAVGIRPIWQILVDRGSAYPPTSNVPRRDPSTDLIQDSDRATRSREHAARVAKRHTQPEE